jgi:hypothetical protein
MHTYLESIGVVEPNLNFSVETGIEGTGKTFPIVVNHETGKTYLAIKGCRYPVYLVNYLFSSVQVIDSYSDNCIGYFK